MSTNNKIILSFLITLCTISSFTSCIKEYDPGFGEHVSKLVVNSVFSPDSVFIVKVSQSKSTVDSITLEYLPGATVELFENGTKIETLIERSIKDTTYTYDPLGGVEVLVISDKFHYESTIKPITENNYSIRVSKEGFETVTAESSTPKILEVITLITDNLVVKEEVYPDGYIDIYIGGSLFFEIADEADVENFYEFNLFYNRTDSIFFFDVENQELVFEGIRTNRYEVYSNVSDGSGNLAQSDDFSLDTELNQFSDVRYDGKTNRFTLSNFRVYFNNAIDIKLELEVISASKEYFNYFTSYEKYRYNEGNFLAEPVIVFNNIENGYGVFVGYTSVVFPIEF